MERKSGGEAVHGTPKDRKEATAHGLLIKQKKGAALGSP